nr:putative metal-binding motif-containing protein [Kofleriaceae bacterium]
MRIGRGAMLATLALALAACSSETGALVILSAPDHPQVATVEIILASADPANITAVTGQRVDETTDQPETVRYFRQRATTGPVKVGGDLDGFRFHVEPNSAVAPDAELVPFAIARAPADANDPAGQILAIGIAHDPTASDPGPVSITIDPDALQVFQVDVEAASATSASVAAQQVDEIACTSSGATTPSGIVWRPASGPELRLLLPLASGGAGEDATTRPLDLDCDGHAPIGSGADCDDLASDVFPGAAETCDGRDTNCDGQPTVFETCATPAGAGSDCSGIAVCNGGSAGACQPDLSCAGTAADAECDITLDVSALPCAPAVGDLALPECSNGSGCTIRVLQSDGVWEATVAAQPQGPFGPTAMTHNGQFSLEVEPMATLPAAQAGPAGQVFLAIQQAAGGVLRYLPVALDYTPGDSCTLQDGGPLDQMACTAK